jgi:hypothetical protein
MCANFGFGASAAAVSPRRTFWDTGLAAGIPIMTSEFGPGDSGGKARPALFLLAA